MTRPGLIGATAVALVLAAPAMAADGHHAKRPAHSVVAYPDAYAYADTEPRLPVENALRWGYSQGYRNYPSGWGGLYGDGRYPGNVISNPR